MASTPGRNVSRLQEAGFTIKVPLPREYEEVIENLEEHEVALLISLKERLEEAEARTAPEVGSFTEYFLAPPF
jgi:hypothetical protein